MIEKALRLAAIACSLLVATGWLWFAVDETHAASTNTVAEIAGQQAQRVADPTPSQEHARERVDGKVHEAIDDANDVLLKPFAAVAAGSSSKWVVRTVPAIIALIAYGFGLAVLARVAAGRW